MILRILTITIICIVVIFSIFWLVNGGFSRGLSFAKGIDNPFSYFVSSSSDQGIAIRLPGQPDVNSYGVDLSSDPNYAEPGSVMETSSVSPAQRQQLGEFQDQYDQLYEQAKKAQNFGNPSPYHGKVTFTQNAAQENAVNNEYVTIQADYRNTTPISLAGWSLQSAVTGVRSPLPQAAPGLISGIVNTVAAVTLNPGATAIVVTGPSPVGVSFRENRCVGYLAELQTFRPSLDQSCPMAETEMPLTAQSIQTYGDGCIDYAKSITQCHFPGRDTLPSNVSAQCKAFLADRLSYNGCVYAHRIENGFYSNAWRLFLASGVPLWRDTHDIVRLLDEKGQTVDVLTY